MTLTLILLLLLLCVRASCFSHVRLYAMQRTVASQAPLSMGFSRQEYWSGLPFPSPGDLPDPGIEPVSLMSPALAGRFFTTSTTWEVHSIQFSSVAQLCPTLCDPVTCSTLGFLILHYLLEFAQTHFH